LAKQATDNSSASSISEEEGQSDDSEEEDDDMHGNVAGPSSQPEKSERKPIERRANKHA
jgi:hypothetical protein